MKKPILKLFGMGFIVLEWQIIRIVVIRIVIG